MRLTGFKCKLSRKKKVPKYLDEEGDFALACLITCEGNLLETLLGCIVQDDVTSGWRYRPGCLKSLLCQEMTFDTCHFLTLKGI